MLGTTLAGVKTEVSVAALRILEIHDAGRA
jgi:hypothetical protein